MHILDDSEHKGACALTVDLKCMTCLLYQLVCCVRENGMGDPTNIVRLWNGMYSRVLLNIYLSNPLPVYMSLIINFWFRFDRIFATHTNGSV